MVVVGKHVYPDKLYYRIGEVCRITGVKPHVLRYWESQFRFLNPAKNCTPNGSVGRSADTDRKTWKRSSPSRNFSMKSGSPL